MGSVEGVDGALPVRVLVVDDDRFALAALEGVLSVDHDVMARASPGDALALARSELKRGRPFDVVCSDFRMREMNGVELLRQMSELPSSPSCVLITGHVEVLTGEHRQAKHILGIVVKPYEPSDLIRLVGRLGRVTRMNRSIRELTARTAVARRP